MTLVFSGSGATIVLGFIALAALLIILIFRDRLKGMSVGFGSYKFTFDEKQQSTSPVSGPAGASSDQPSVSVAAAEAESQNKELRENKYQAIIELNSAIESRNREGIEAAFAKLKLNPPWNMTDDEINAWEQDSLLVAGFSDALQTLIKIHGENNKLPYAARRLSRYYLRMKAYEEAYLYANSAIERSRSQSDKANSHILMSEIIKENKGDNASAQYLINSADNISDKKEISRLYTEAGNALKLAGEDNRAFASYEIALRADIHNESARFAIAYMASTKEATRLISLRHYRIYLESEVGSTVATNNLGVLYGELGLAQSKIRYWRMAQKNDDGFATGNLAMAFIDAGMADEAQRELDSAPDNIKNHTRMLHARSNLEAERDNDRRQAADLNEKAEKIWQSLRPWESDLSITDADCIGEWTCEFAANLSISKAESRYIINIKEGEYSIITGVNNVAGFSAYAATRDYRDKKSSILGSLGLSTTGTLFMCAKADSISVVYASQSQVMAWEFRKTAN